MNILIVFFILCSIVYTHAYSTHDDVKCTNSRRPQTKQERVYTGNLQMQESLKLTKSDQSKKTQLVLLNNNIVKPCLIITQMTLHPQPKKDSVCL